jgi:uncharacterized protein (DUF1778 family)
MIQFHDYTACVSERKSARKELCLKPSVAAVIKKAAVSLGMDESTFIASAAYKKAQDIEQSQFASLISDAQFAAFAAAVDAPGQRNEALADVMKRGRTLFVDG